MLSSDLKKQSQVIDSLRFPLMLLVVFIHVPINTAEMPLWEYTIADGQAIYIYISRLISYVIGAAAVPCFFVFSGYYACAKNPDKWLTIEGYKSELVKKSKTLLLPYIIWNILMFLSIWLKGNLVSIITTPDTLTFPPLTIDFLKSVFWEGPINMPLWYVRDLLILSLVAPCLVWAIKRSRYTILLLFVLFFGFSVPFSLSASYFSIGILFAVHGKSLVAFSQRYFRVLMLITIPLNLFFPFVAHVPYYMPYINVLNTLLLIFCIIGIGAYIYDSKRVYIERLLQLNVYVFFIYVAHEVFILATIKGVLARLGLWQYGWGGIVGYFVCGILTTVVCIGVYRILQRVTPRLLAFSLGGR